MVQKSREFETRACLKDLSARYNPSERMFEAKN